MANQIDAKVNQRINDINNNNNIYDVGKVTEIRDFIANVSGLNNVKFYEKVVIGSKGFGYVNQINNNYVSVALLKIDSPINVGDVVESTGEIYNGQFSKESIGRVIDLFGFDKLNNKKFSNLINVPIERKTIPIMDRTSVNRPLYTGITGIDLMYPIGKGQRQLIIGDKRTGKTQLCLDTIVNQKNNNVLCLYVAIGKTKKEVKTIYNELLKHGALAYTIIITAFNDELPPVLSLIPYFAASVAENYMMEGYDVLVCIDDLKRHAEAYREISLISGKTPGRDAYPADIFYTHSRLLEKGCQYKNGGSITILPIVETKGSDITDYISTNIISITDGQIVLSSKNFQKGQKPAIDYGLSVSRLGGSVQEDDMKVLGTKIRQKLLSYLDTKYVYELVNMDDMTSELKNQFMEGEQIVKNLNQYKYRPKSKEEMIDLFSNNTEVLEVNQTENNTETEILPTQNNVETQTAVSAPVNESVPMDNTNNVQADPMVQNMNQMGIYVDTSTPDGQMVMNAQPIEQAVPETVDPEYGQVKVIVDPVDPAFTVDNTYYNNQTGTVAQDYNQMGVAVDTSSLQTPAYAYAQTVVEQPQSSVYDNSTAQVAVAEASVMEQPAAVPIETLPVDNNAEQALVLEEPVIEQEQTVQMETIPVENSTEEAAILEEPVIEQEQTVQMETIPVENSTEEAAILEEPVIEQEQTVQMETIPVDNVPTNAVPSSLYNIETMN